MFHASNVASSQGVVSMKNICMIGSGYVGLVTGACFADLGNRVVGLDVDEARIKMLRSGVSPIY